jgi:hypothetical protein
LFITIFGSLDLKLLKFKPSVGFLYGPDRWGEKSLTPAVRFATDDFKIRAAARILKKSI